MPIASGIRRVEDSAAGWPFTRPLGEQDGVLVDPAFTPTSPGLLANADYMDDPQWAEEYFRACHRDEAFAERWRRAAGPWDDKVVVDVGCGPGNLFATLGGRPKQLIGVDVSAGSLRMAAGRGYTPVLADAHDMPIQSGCADLVAVNATLHHCEDMPTVLAEAARLVRPGGALVCDHDPQLSAWDWKGFAMLAFRLRLPIYRMFAGAARSEQVARLRSELHHRPGHGVTRELFKKVLEPAGFKVDLFPHNNEAGSEALDGVRGPMGLKYRLGQVLSGISSRSPGSGLSLMCLARRMAA